MPREDKIVRNRQPSVEGHNGRIKAGQSAFSRNSGLSTDQWETVFDKVTEYCVWRIIEGGVEPTTRHGSYEPSKIS